jgi:hypothetical protein
MSTHVRGSVWLWALSLITACRIGAAPMKAPTEVLVRMTKGGISLRAETRPIGPKGAPALLHLWVVPTGRDSSALIEPRDTKGPITRDEITGGPSLKPSPFHLDVFARRDNSWKAINSVVFQQGSDVQNIETRWLHPRERRGPVLALHFGYAHWHDWQLIVFPQGLGGAARLQQFLWGGEGGVGATQRLDRVDARGVMRIEEEEYSYANDKPEKHFYNWNGAQFVDPLRYFVLGATTKTEDEASAFVRRHKLKNAFVHWTDDFPLLRRGYAVVILGRYNSLAAAQRARKTFRGRDFKPYVKRAF